jgi:hypothetical protein
MLETYNEDAEDKGNYAEDMKMHSKVEHTFSNTEDDIHKISNKGPKGQDNKEDLKDEEISTSDTFNV